MAGAVKEDEAHHPVGHHCEEDEQTGKEGEHKGLCPGEREREREGPATAGCQR